MEERDDPMSPAELLAVEKAAQRRATVVLACRVREVREKLGLSLDQVADAIGSSKQWLSTVERGSNARLDLAMRLATFFGVAVEELWTRTDED